MRHPILPLTARDPADERAMTSAMRQDESMAVREFPFTPSSSSKLELGDLIAVPCEGGAWAALQVSALRRTGPGSRTTLGVGVLPWRGDHKPTADDIRGLAFADHGLTSIEIFSEGHAEVVANAPLASGQQSTLNEFIVGSSHRVWGWLTALERARAAAAGA